MSSNLGLLPLLRTFRSQQHTADYGVSRVGARGRHHATIIESTRLGWDARNAEAARLVGVAPRS